MSASAGRRELNAADCCFVFLIAYMHEGLVLAWILSQCAAAFRDCHCGAHGLLARLASWMRPLDVRITLLFPFSFVLGWRQLISWLYFTGMNNRSHVSIFSHRDTQETNFYSGIN